MPWISSANIACGFHAGDPSTMRASARLAIEHGVGDRRARRLPRPARLRPAHDRRDPGRGTRLHDLPDRRSRRDRALRGRPARPRQATRRALRALLIQRGARLGGGGGDRRPRRRLPLLLLSPEIAPAVQAHGVRLVIEAFPDLDYEPSGRLVIEPVKQAWDPDRVAERAVRDRPAPPHRRDRRQRARRGRADTLPSWRRAKRAGDRTDGPQRPRDVGGDRQRERVVTRAGDRRPASARTVSAGAGRCRSGGPPRPSRASR